MSLTRGIVLLSWGKRGYGFMAYNLAVSLKFYSPDIPITLICDRESTKQVGEMSIFDSVHIIDNQVDSPGRFKATLYHHLPYDFNLYLDVDAICLKDITPLFESLINQGGYYYTFINAVYDKNSENILPDMYWANKDVIWNHYGFTDEKLPATQSSIQFIKKCDEAFALFETLETSFDNPIPLEQLRYQWGGNQPDELYLNVALAIKGLAPHIGNDVIYFGNKRDFTPSQVQEKFYFLSYFGYRNNIKSDYWEFYDKLLILMCRKRGINHAFKSHLIISDKHANNKATVIVKKEPEAVPQKSEKRPGQIFLFTSVYNSSDRNRNQEITETLNKNINCIHIDKIFNLGNRLVEHEKVVNLFYERPTYSDFIKEIKEHGSDDYNIISNSDIFFDSTIELIKDVDFTGKLALALSRYNKVGSSWKLFNYELSQDSWIFKSKPEGVSDIDHSLGLPGCENRFAYQLSEAGYKVVNPCNDIKTYHNHRSLRRNYSEKDRVHGKVMPVPPCSMDGIKQKTLLINQPGKLGDIICCLPIAEFYSKQGYKVTWLCPDIYHPVFQYVDYCTPVTVAHSKYDKVIDLSFGINPKSENQNVWQAVRSKTSFVELKYRISEVPLSFARKLNYKRDHKKEQELFDLLVGDGKPYQLIHSSSDYGSHLQFEGLSNPIEFKPVEGFYIFDWRKVIESAEQIHVIDSSLCNFVDAIAPEKPELYYYISDRVPLKGDRTLLTCSWNIINTLQNEPATL